MKVVFMGTPQAAVPSLRRLIEDGHEIVAVYCQPDRPSGRGNKITYSPVKELALDRGLDIVQPTTLRSEEEASRFASLGAGVAVVIAYGRILPESFLTAFRYGAVNVHFSLLPKYRGAAPANWAIVNQEKITGVTTMKMDAGLDTGPILLQSETDIGERETAPELTARLAAMGADLIAETLNRIDAIEPTAQDDSEASLAPILKREDGLIDWTMAASGIEARIRGFQPFPGTYTLFRNERLTLWSGNIEVAVSAPGSVTEAARDRLVIACGSETALRIEELQLAGKRVMSTRDFLNGVKVAVGEKFGE